MTPIRIAAATTWATWVLLIIGGLVNPMGASLACPDWYFVPTCNGELLPEMRGGVLYEHGHRLWASWVGLLTVGLAVSLRKHRARDPGTWKLGLFAVALVAFQGTLGGITVKLGLHPLISTLHLGTAMGFFLLVHLIWFRLRHPTASGSSVARGPVLAALLGVLAQILLGGAVRHLGAGLICGDDVVGCGPDAAWTVQPLAHLHMTHRVIGYLLILLVGWAAGAAAREARRTQRSSARAIGQIPAWLVLVQVGLGLLTVGTSRNAAIVTAHTAFAGLLLLSLHALYLRLGPRGRRDP